MWIDFNEWNKLKIWKHYRELFMSNHWSIFGIPCDYNKIKEDKFEEDFNEFYKKEYPDNYKLLNIEEWKR